VAQGIPARLVVLSAPSGAGKTTLVHELLRRRPDLRFSVSFTTRRARESETHGEDYFFVTEKEFERMLARDEFLESARVFGHWYGTSREHVCSLLARGHSVLLEIDWQGAAQIRARAPEAIGIFILPPSRAELERRLRGRGTDSEATIQRRLQEALSDMTHWEEFDFVLINEDVEAAAAQMEEILAGRGAESRADSAAIRSAAEAILARG
jgi:guanylate kinase